MAGASADSLPFDPVLDGTVPARFARVAAAYPDAVAIACGAERLTYAALDRRSSGLAAAIAAAVPAGEAPIAVVLDDPVAVVVGLLAIWKVGRISVAVEPSQPAARLAAILEDATAALVVTDAVAQPVIAAAGLTTPCLRLDQLDLDAPGAPPAPTGTPDSPLSLIYTSGSTGTPKGVLQTHRGRLHRVRAAVTSLGVRAGDRVSNLNSPSLANGMRDVLTALLTGATLLPFDVRRAGMGAMADWLDREHVSVLCIVVSTFRQLVAGLDADRRFPSVRIVRVGSEAAYRDDVVAFRRHFPAPAVLVAGYGASEAAGLGEYRIGPDTPLPEHRVPAGHALEGVEFLVVGDDGQTLPSGEVGEVVARSVFLSPGYWGRAELTGAVFQADAGATRLYRTGDVGRLGPDGCLMLLGRRDHQVKVRGYRVHPGEIEAALAAHPALREAVVVGRPTPAGDITLVAYVVPVSAPAPAPAALRRFLHARVPAQMVPAAFVALDALPSLSNGKVDRAALPPPPAEGERETAFVAPGDPLEHQIAALWEELLGVRPVGATDDFFALGGNSLLAATFVTALERVCGQALSPAVLVEAPTVRELAARLVDAEARQGRTVIALRPDGPLAPLFFLHGDYNGGGLYCHGLARALDPARPFYAVHPHGLGAAPVPETIEAMATELVAAVRAVRPHGPYALAGHCNGGVVALEMARQLRAAGEAVEALALIEAVAPRPTVRALHQLSGALGRVRGLSAERRAALHARLEQDAERWAMRARYYGARLARAARGELRTPAGASAPVSGNGNGAPPPRLPGQRTGAREVYHRALRRYVPPTYAGPVAIIEAADEPPRPAALGWTAVLPHVRVAVVPGDHLTCVTRHVAAFAPELDRALRGH